MQNKIKTKGDIYLSQFKYKHKKNYNFTTCTKRPWIKTSAMHSNKISYIAKHLS